MKRLFMVVVAMLSMTMTFAENENAANLNNAEAYNMTVNMKKLGQALNLSKDQMESFCEVHKTFSAEMQFAAQYGRYARLYATKYQAKSPLSRALCTFLVPTKNRSVSSTIWPSVIYCGIPAWTGLPPT